MLCTRAVRVGQLMLRTRAAPEVQVPRSTAKKHRKHTALTSSLSVQWLWLTRQALREVLAREPLAVHVRPGVVGAPRVLARHKAAAAGRREGVVGAERGRGAANPNVPHSLGVG